MNAKTAPESVGCAGDWSARVGTCCAKCCVARSEHWRAPTLLEAIRARFVADFDADSFRVDVYELGGEYYVERADAISSATYAVDLDGDTIIGFENV